MIHDDMAHHRMKLDKPGARSISLAEFIAGLKLSEQLDDELTPTAVKETWLATLSFDVRPDLVSEVTIVDGCPASNFTSSRFQNDCHDLVHLDFDICRFTGRQRA
jgi:hypothetical protein